MWFGLDSAIVLAGSVSRASPHFREAGERGRGLLQLDAAAAEKPTQAQVSTSGSWTTAESNEVQDQLHPINLLNRISPRS